MRKIVSLALVGAVCFPLIAFSACKETEENCRYRIEAEYFTEGRLEGIAEITVPNNTENVLGEIPFALYANSFREGAKTAPVSDLFSSACFYEGESYGGMEIGEVTGGESWEVTGEDGEILKIKLSEPLYPDESATVSVRYTLTLAKANHRLGIGENCVNLSYFYPMLFAQSASGFYEYAPAEYGEPFVLGCADFDIALTVPEGLNAACGGKTQERKENGKLVVTCKSECVRDAAFVLGDFSLVSAEQNGVAVDYYYFSDGEPQKTLDAACAALSTYSDLFGKYAYPRFALAETDLYFGGMEYCGFATISCALRSGERAAVVAHETAHQWWYASVGSDQAGCAFQDEGLAEYSVALFYENNPDYGAGYRDAIALSENAYRNYFAIQSQLSESVDTGMVRPLRAYSGDYEYRILSYDKGVVLFDRLRETMGDRKFFSALKTYAGKFAHKVATQYDFLSCFSSEEALILSFTEGRVVI